MALQAENVGILAMDVYFPKTTVNQADLEIFDKAKQGKYTSGLGQANMGFLSDREDIISISLTALHNFIEKFHIDTNTIGRLEVGTESLIDKAKAVKTYLMTLFPGNANIEGVDTINACYGATNAVFNAVNWIESRSWDGRLAIVVAADVAVYAPGPARPTGGCGVVVLLIGPKAPIVFETNLKSSYVEHTYDFFKPHPESEYPYVDGKLSVQDYFKALDYCYEGYSQKFNKITGTPFTLSAIDYYVAHSPYHKIVQQGYARLIFNEFLENPDNPQYASLARWKNINKKSALQNRTIANAFLAHSKAGFKEKVEPSSLLSIEIGNMDCAAVWASLLSLFDNKGDQLVGKRILLFSYGSGLTSSMFSFKVVAPVAHFNSNLKIKLARRTFVNPAKYTKMLQETEERYHSAPYEPKQSLDLLLPGTYYLEKIDEQSRRYYARIPCHAKL